MTSTPADVPLVPGLILFLETGEAPQGLFAPDVFSNVSLPLWRLQGSSIEELIAIRKAGHPCPGEVRVERVEQTSHGFTLEFEERWIDGGQRWYSREMLRADVDDDQITELSVYCTGDWDEAVQRRHTASVELVRP